MDEKKITRAIYFAKLLHKKKVGILSAEESHSLEQCINSGGIETQLHQQFLDFSSLESPLLEQEEYDIKNRIHKLFLAAGIPLANETSLISQGKKRNYWWIAVVAFVLLGAGTLYFVNQSKISRHTLLNNNIPDNEILPYSKKTILAPGNLYQAKHSQASLPGVR